MKVKFLFLLAPLIFASFAQAGPSNRAECEEERRSLEGTPASAQADAVSKCQRGKKFTGSAQVDSIRKYQRGKKLRKKNMSFELYTFTESCSMYKDLFDEKLVSLVEKAKGPLALYTLSLLYLEGLGVKQDIEKGFNLCKQAADEGNEIAQEKLRTLYSARTK